MYFAIVTLRANKTSIISIPPIRKFITRRIYSRIGFEMEQAITARFLEICREHVKIPKLLVLNEDGAMTEEELAVFHNAEFLCANPDHYREAIVHNGGAWDWEDGSKKEVYHGSFHVMVATMGELEVLQYSGGDVVHHTAINNRLVFFSAQLMTLASLNKRYNNVVMLAPAFTLTEEDEQDEEVELWMRITTCEIYSEEVEEIVEEEEIRKAEQTYWQEIASAHSEIE